MKHTPNIVPALQAAKGLKRARLYHIKRGVGKGLLCLHSQTRRCNLHNLHNARAYCVPLQCAEGS
jgi:hypothetical protein